MLVELTPLMVVSQRQPITRNPADVGLAYEDVEFNATDGVRIKGWFLPGPEPAPARGPTVVIVHGWMWNRAGNVAGLVPFKDRDVDFLPNARALHDAGMHVLMFDLSNHGESGSRFPMTFGAWEGRDLVGAMSYLRMRPDVDPVRIGILGTSMGGNTALEAAPYCQPIPAMLLIQPNRAGTFISRFARDHLGKRGPAILHPTTGATRPCAPRAPAKPTRPPPRGCSPTPSASTSRAPATPGARWPTSRPWSPPRHACSRW